MIINERVIYEIDHFYEITLPSSPATHRRRAPCSILGLRPSQRISPVSMVMRMVRMKAIVDETIESVCVALKELRPPSLDDYGLVVALPSVANHFTRYRHQCCGGDGGDGVATGQSWA